MNATIKPYSIADLEQAAADSRQAREVVELKETLMTTARRNLDNADRDLSEAKATLATKEAIVSKVASALAAGK